MIPMEEHAAIEYPKVYHVRYTLALEAGIHSQVSDCPLPCHSFSLKGR